MAAADQLLPVDAASAPAAKDPERGMRALSVVDPSAPEQPAALLQRLWRAISGTSLKQKWLIVGVVTFGLCFTALIVQHLRSTQKGLPCPEGSVPTVSHGRMLMQSGKVDCNQVTYVEYTNEGISFTDAFYSDLALRNRMAIVLHMLDLTPKAGGRKDFEPPLVATLIAEKPEVGQAMAELEILISPQQDAKKLKEVKIKDVSKDKVPSVPECIFIDAKNLKSYKAELKVSLREGDAVIKYDLGQRAKVYKFQGYLQDYLNMMLNAETKLKDWRRDLAQGLIGEKMADVAKKVVDAWTEVLSYYRMHEATVKQAFEAKLAAILLDVQKEEYKRVISHMNKWQMCLNCPMKNERNIKAEKGKQDCETVLEKFPPEAQEEGSFWKEKGAKIAEEASADHVKASSGAPARIFVNDEQ